VTTGGPARDVWSDLVAGLLDARSDPATARFDAELTAGLADGSLTDEAAHRLRFWQRASVRLLADHARTVLPVALGALEAARNDAERYVEEAAALLDEPREGAEPSPEGVEPSREPAEPQQARTVDVGAVEAARRASAPQPPETSTLDVRRPRLLVAGLTTAPVRSTPASPDRAS
jgi:hypothetical protein